MPNSYFPATHSLLSASALLSYAQEHYEMGRALECHLLDRGWNDTYLIRASSGNYIVRVYRTGWRSLSDILYELDMLLHLHGKDVPVSSPLAMKEGSLVSTVNTLEGPRQVVLFTFAEGERPRWPRDETYSRAYGQAVARVHSALDDFTSPHTRFGLDLDHLLENPLRTILPLLSDRPEDQAYLLDLVTVIKQRLDDLPRGELEWGACHGDFHGGNARIRRAWLASLRSGRLPLDQGIKARGEALGGLFSWLLAAENLMHARSRGGSLLYDHTSNLAPGDAYLKRCLLGL